VLSYVLAGLVRLLVINTVYATMIVVGPIRYFDAYESGRKVGSRPCVKIQGQDGSQWVDMTTGTRFISLYSLVAAPVPSWLIVDRAVNVGCACLLSYLLICAASAFLRMNAAYRQAKGRQIRIVSGFRTNDKQTELYNGYVQRRPGYNLAARPGYSNHQVIP